MNNSLYEQYEAFLVDPTAYRYRRIRRLLIQSADWSNSPARLLRASSLIESGDLQEAELLLESSLPTWLLSPRLHFLTGKIASLRGEDEFGQVDRFQMHACLKGIMRTGDGSPKAPFSLTYPTDALDLVWSLKLEAQTSQIVRTDSGILEVIGCGQNQELWFDCSAFIDEPIRVQHVQELTPNSMLSAPQMASRWN